MQSSGKESNVGLNDGLSVSAVEKVVPDGLGGSSESSLSVSSSDTAVRIREQGVTRSFPPARNSKDGVVSDSLLSIP